jgi:hypothetical protein
VETTAGSRRPPWKRRLDPDRRYPLHPLPALRLRPDAARPETEWQWGDVRACMGQWLLLTKAAAVDDMLVGLGLRSIGIIRERFLNPPSWRSAGALMGRRGG